MITSGAGLIVGVLAYTFLHLLQGKIDGFLLKMQRQVLEFKNLLL
jgi:biopolymer transport protein ExbB